MSNGQGSYTIEEVVDHIIHVSDYFSAFGVRHIIASALIDLKNAPTLVENSVEAMIKNHLRELAFNLESS